MRSRVVVVADKTPVLVEQVRLRFVGFVERFYLAYSCGPAHAGGDMLNSHAPALSGKLRCSSSGRLKLCSLVSKYLFWNTIPFNGFFK